MRVVVGTSCLLALAVLSGCGGEAEVTPSAPPSAATSAETPPPTYALADLAAALPDEAALAEYDSVTVCPGGERCARQETPTAASVQANNKGTEATWKLGDSVWMSFTVYDDHARAEEAFSNLQQDAEQHDGDFEEPAEDHGENRYRPGRVGTGSVTDLGHAGWHGHRVSATFHLTDTDGERTDAPLADAAIALTRGNAVLRVVAVSAGASASEAETVAGKWMETILESVP